MLTTCVAVGGGGVKAAPAVVVVVLLLLVLVLLPAPPALPSPEAAARCRGYAVQSEGSVRQASALAGG